MLWQGVLLTGRFAGKPEGVAKTIDRNRPTGPGPLLANDVRGCDDGTIDSSRYQRPARHEALRCLIVDFRFSNLKSKIK